MDEPRDSPVHEPAGEAAQRRRQRIFWSAFGGVHMFLLYALVLAGVILLVIYLTGGFGEGAE